MNNSENTYSQAIWKKLTLFVFALVGLGISSLPAYSQSESQTDTTYQEVDSIVKYITPMEYAFMMHEETSWLFKGSYQLVNYGRSSLLKVAVEKRLAESFTLDLSVELSAYEINADMGYIARQGIQTSLETRWYYRANKRIREKKIARNMSDNYFSLGLSYTRFTSNNENNFVSAYAKWGLQRRFLKHGHADIGIKAGIGQILNSTGSSFFIFSTYTNFGLAFTKDKFNLDRNKLCPVLKCYEGEKYAIKSNLISLLSLTLFNNYRRIMFVPHIAFERKIANSAFSINTELELPSTYARYKTNNDNELFDHYWWYIYADLTIEGRFYYNLKRRILKGKTGNGLSADYVAIGGQYRNVISSAFDGIYDSYSKVHIVSGWQRLFSEHLYYDIQIGVEYYFPEERIDPKFKFAVGYRF